MRTLIRCAARLYPPRWRRRYGSEFDALLEDIRPGWREFFNVLKGALAMQIRHFGVIAAGFAVVGALVAGLVSWRIPDKYVSSGMVYFGRPEATKDIRGLVVQSTSRSSLLAIVKKHKLYERELTEKPLEELIERMRLRIRVAPAGDLAFSIAFRDEDPAKARAVVNELMYVLMENNFFDRKAKAASTPEPLLQSLHVLDPPSVPTKPSDPNRLMIYGLGVGIGALTGAIVAWFRRTPNPRTA